MRLPVSDLQQSLDTVLPCRFSVEDDEEVMRVYSNFDEPVFDFHLASEGGSEEGEDRCLGQDSGRDLGREGGRYSSSQISGG